MSFGEHPQIAIAITVSQWCAHIPGNEWRAGDVMKWCAHTEKKKKKKQRTNFFGRNKFKHFCVSESLSACTNHMYPVQVRILHTLQSHGSA